MTAVRNGSCSSFDKGVEVVGLGMRVSSSVVSLWWISGFTMIW